MYGKIGAALGAVALAVSGYTAFTTSNQRINVDPQVVHAAFGDYLARNPDAVGTSVRAYMDARPGLAADAAAAPSGDAIRAYLLANPEVIVEAINVFEENQKLAAAAADEELVSTNAKEIFEDGFSIVRGNPDGDVTVVEFADYNCGYCKRAHTEVEKFVAADGNIRLVIKEFPILGEGSVFAARAALASGMQGDGALYPDFNDALMAHRGSHTEESVMKVAAEVGLDVEALTKDMQSEEVRLQINRTYELAQTLKINGTPAFVIGDEVVRGYVPADRLAQFAQVARDDS